MIIHPMPQRSPEWYKVRAGKFTASDLPTLMPSSRQGISDFNETQMKIIYRAASERMTGMVVGGGFTSQAMQWGIDTEDEARCAYEMETGYTVEQVGFIEYSDWFGCSPDGLIGEDGYWEAKCPNSDTHLRYLRHPQKLCDDYGWQVQGGLLASGRKWADLISYDPRYTLPEHQLVRFNIIACPEQQDLILHRLRYAIAEAMEIMG